MLATFVQEVLALQRLMIQQVTCVVLEFTVQMVPLVRSHVLQAPITHTLVKEYVQPQVQAITLTLITAPSNCRALVVSIVQLAAKLRWSVLLVATAPQRGCPHKPSALSAQQPFIVHMLVLPTTRINVSLGPIVNWVHMHQQEGLMQELP